MEETKKKKVGMDNKKKNSNFFFRFFKDVQTRKKIEPAFSRLLFSFVSFFFFPPLQGSSWFVIPIPQYL